MTRDRPSITAPDGSTVRELIQTRDGASNLSLAEATVPPGAETVRHIHHRSEEIYFFTAGVGRMFLGDEEMDVRAGVSVLIAPGTPHKLVNASDSEPLVLLCCCSPPYRDDDTELLE